MNEELGDPANAGLTVDRVGPHMLLHDGRLGPEREFLAGLASITDQPAVLLAAEAYTRPRVSAELRAALAVALPLLVADDGPSAVWLGIDDLGSWASMVTGLAGSIGTTVMAPVGGLLFASGVGIYVGPASRGTEWRAFEPSGENRSGGPRYPRPRWGRGGFDGTEAAGLVAVPVLCGVAVCSATSPAPDADHIAHRVALDTSTPRVVLDPASPLAPAAVAELLARLAPSGSALQLVPSTEQTADRTWLADVARRWGHDLVATTGLPLVRAGTDRTVLVGADGVVPSPSPVTSLRVRTDGSSEVLEAVDAPAGNTPSARTSLVDAPTVPLPVVGHDATVALPATPEAPPRPSPVLPSVAPMATESSDPVPPEAAGLASPGRVPVTAAVPVEVETVSLAVEVDRAPGAGVDEQASEALEIATRPSAERERQRFSAAAGEAFTEALSTVNAAFATWPALRRDDSPGAKADLAAVCLYLGEGETGAAAVNQAIRSGVAGVVEGQVACLVAGLQRLPTHRRPVLHQSTRTEPAADAGLVGRTVREPGFVSATTRLDVTASAAEVDVLIWPSTVRRTGELTARAVDEAVFVAGSRFKALAVRDADGAGEPSTAPSTAVLMREIAPDERPDEEAVTVVEARDQAALTRLDRALTARRGSSLSLIEDAGVAARLTATIAGLDAPGAEFRATASLAAGR